MDPQAKRPRTGDIKEDDGNLNESSVPVKELDAILDLDEEAFQKNVEECDDQNFALLESKVALLESKMSSLQQILAKTRFYRTKKAETTRALEQLHKKQQIYKNSGTTNTPTSAATSAHLSTTIPIEAEVIRCIASYLNLVDKGNFLLLTTKMFVQELGYDTVWKDIFATTWKAKIQRDGKIESLYGCNHPLEAIIKVWGHEWVFKQLFLKKPSLSPAATMTSTAGLPRRPTALNRNNCFLLINFLTTENQQADNKKHMKVFHSVVVDKQKLGLMDEGPCTYRFNFGDLPMSSDQFKDVYVKVLAFRLDTHECSVLSFDQTGDTLSEESPYDDIVSMGGEALILGGLFDETQVRKCVPLNSVGQQLLLEMNGPTSDPGNHYEVNLDVRIDHTSQCVDFSLGWSELEDENDPWYFAGGRVIPRNGVSFFQILDQGIHWNSMIL